MMLIPVGDDNRFRRTIPVITWLLVVTNIAVFILEILLGDAFINEWAFVPARFLADPDGNWLTIFSSMFMHAGWLHIIGNMLYLFIFGDNVEDVFGHFTFLLFYLVCGIVATFAQMAIITSSNLPSVGASGAIAGVLAAYVFMFPRAQVRVLMWFFIVPLPALFVIGFWIILQVLSQIGSISDITQEGGVAYMAHIGGFFTGLILTILLRKRVAGRRRRRY